MVSWRPCLGGTQNKEWMKSQPTKTLLRASLGLSRKPSQRRYAIIHPFFVFDRSYYSSLRHCFQSFAYYSVIHFPGFTLGDAWSLQLFERGRQEGVQQGLQCLILSLHGYTLRVLWRCGLWKWNPECCAGWAEVLCEFCYTKLSFLMLVVFRAMLTDSTQFKIK